jgi:hypothetical protein
VRQEISRLFAEQVYWLRDEFTTDPENTIEQLEQRATAGLHRYGALQAEADGTWRLGSMVFVRELADLTRNFLESTLLVLDAAPGSQPKESAALAKRIQEIGRKQVEAGQIKRPEALSIANLKNAIRCFSEDGTLRLDVGRVGVDADLQEAYSRDLHLLLK